MMNVTIRIRDIPAETLAALVAVIEAEGLAHAVSES